MNGWSTGTSSVSMPQSSHSRNNLAPHTHPFTPNSLYLPVFWTVVLLPSLHNTQLTHFIHFRRKKIKNPFKLESKYKTNGMRDHFDNIETYYGINTLPTFLSHSIIKLKGYLFKTMLLPLLVTWWRKVLWPPPPGWPNPAAASEMEARRKIKLYTSWSLSFDHYPFVFYEHFLFHGFKDYSCSQW